MMLARNNSSNTSSQNSIKNVKQNDSMFFSKRLTSKVSLTNLSSLEDNYHGGSSVTIPFIWESEPGTPKVKHFRENPLPPLTPPPSYFYASPKRTAKKHSKATLLDTFFTKRGTRRDRLSSSSRYSCSNSRSLTSSSSPSSPSSWSRISSPRPSSYSVPSSPMINPNTPGTRQLFNARMMEERRTNECKSALCFGNIGHGGRAMRPGCYASLIKVLLN